MSEFIEFDTEMTIDDAIIIVKMLDRMHGEVCMSHIASYDAQLDYIYSLNI